MSTIRVRPSTWTVHTGASETNFDSFMAAWHHFQSCTTPAHLLRNGHLIYPGWLPTRAPDQLF